MAAQGVSNIHNDEVIITCAVRPLVLAFLTEAATPGKLHVTVAERAPERDVRRFVRLSDVVVSDVQSA